MRVSISAIGSCMLISLTPEIRYQEAFFRPGISPFMACSRTLMRDRPNLRRKPCGRPVILQRLRWRDGLESRGSCCSCSTASQRASSEAFISTMIAFSSVRLVANLATSFARFASRAFMDVLAITLTLLAEWEVKGSQQSTAFFIGIRGSGDGDIQTTDAIDFVIVDFREDDLLTHAHGVVT